MSIPTPNHWPGRSRGVDSWAGSARTSVVKRDLRPRGQTLANRADDQHCAGRFSHYLIDQNIYAPLCRTRRPIADLFLRSRGSDNSRLDSSDNKMIATLRDSSPKRRGWGMGTELLKFVPFALSREEETVSPALPAYREPSRYPLSACHLALWSQHPNKHPLFSLSSTGPGRGGWMAGS